MLVGDETRNGIDVQVEDGGNGMGVTWIADTCARICKMKVHWR